MRAITGILFSFIYLLILDRAPPQRPPSVQRVQVGQSSAIRQALGHLPSTPATSASTAPTEPVSLNGVKLLDKVQL